jgi:hypothetical protein
VVGAEAGPLVRIAVVFGNGGGVMQDLFWIAVTIAFFVVSIGYVYFCDRVR